MFLHFPYVQQILCFVYVLSSPLSLSLSPVILDLPTHPNYPLTLHHVIAVIYLFFYQIQIIVLFIMALYLAIIPAYYLNNIMFFCVSILCHLSESHHPHPYIVRNVPSSSCGEKNCNYKFCKINF